MIASVYRTAAPFNEASAFQLEQLQAQRLVPGDVILIGSPIEGHAPHTSVVMAVDIIGDDAEITHRPTRGLGQPTELTIGARHMLSRVSILGAN